MKGMTEKTVAIYMSIPDTENVTFADESYELGYNVYVYLVQELPGGGIWWGTGNVVFRYINRK